MNEYVCKIDPVTEPGIEVLSLSPADIKSHVFCIGLRWPDHAQLIIPSLAITINISDKDDSFEKVKSVVIDKLKDLSRESYLGRERALKELGWKKVKGYNARYSRELEGNFSSLQGDGNSELALIRVMSN